jgi:hypothetical protein
MLFSYLDLVHPDAKHASQLMEKRSGLATPSQFDLEAGYQTVTNGQCLLNSDPAAESRDWAAF